ncbi:serine hydrolase domain-containing protein [Ktedonospora formicarum]|uniref:6-aminohexanoate-dimer hydrolase n=1 Tax=Ktedonospora formicarum TaxID=2778364 RepID=A0A8J3I1L3_9CHLR|nr:serine hydrolase [Ktedonospora formicarum]GHO48347.1 6-aminohexanoate-dimer hydrolase [Ktedonospora formicarum]
MRSILIVRSGYLLFEQYYQGAGPLHYHNINSITKSITSALVGIALQEGLLSSLDQCLLPFFPHYFPDDVRKQDITIRHLLTMSSGFQEPSDDILTFLEDTASTEKILARPMRHTPGKVHRYDDVSLHCLSLILTSLTKMPLAAYAQSRLFEPLGIWQDEEGRKYPWRKGTSIKAEPHPLGLWTKDDTLLWSIDTRGFNPAGYGLQLTPREMAKFGYLCLNGGSWDGLQVIPAAYMQETWMNHMTTPKGEGYGYLWFLPQWNGCRVCCAAGHGGQVIAVVPDLDLVVVITMQTHIGPDGPPLPPLLMKEFVLPAFSPQETTPSV